MGAGAVRVATGVFSLLVSWEEVVLGGFVGDDGSGGRKPSASSDSDGAGRGMEDGRTRGAGGGRFGMGNSSRAICSGTGRPPCQLAGQDEMCGGGGGPLSALTFSMRVTMVGSRAGQAELHE